MINETLIIKQAFIVFCIVVTIWKCFQSDMIFGKIGDWVANYDHEGFSQTSHWIRYPVSECPVCQTPWYGTVAYWVIFGSSWQEWLLVIGVAMGMATVFVSIKKK